MRRAPAHEVSNTELAIINDHDQYPYGARFVELDEMLSQRDSINTRLLHIIVDDHQPVGN